MDGHPVQVRLIEIPDFLEWSQQGTQVLAQFSFNPHRLAPQGFDLLPRRVAAIAVAAFQSLQVIGQVFFALVEEHLQPLFRRIVGSLRLFLLLVGHMDTVLPAIPPRIEGDRLIATGGLDMKAGLVMLVGALDLLAARGQQPPQDLLLVAVPDEEVGGQISESVVRRWGAGARAMLVLEPGERACDAETLVAGRRGMAEWRLDVVGKAAHSGLAYWEGRSAAAAAADWAAQAQALSERGPGVTVNVARMIGGDADFVGNLAAHHELLGSPRRRNVVSERAVAEGEVRFLSIEDRERVLGALAALAAALGVGVLITSLRAKPGAK